jgi:hypothetical protein
MVDGRLHNVKYLEIPMISGAYPGNFGQCTQIVSANNELIFASLNLEKGYKKSVLLSAIFFEIMILLLFFNNIRLEDIESVICSAQQDTRDLSVPSHFFNVRLALVHEQQGFGDLFVVLVFGFRFNGDIPHGDL